ncbi:thiopurine S-methyltransferase [Hoeflea sp. EC-HK425]|uniref:thiopurine S-methyltransferase n=1 Tax=Hoeflea sp. EC-HK425 TaxID=2038388 RepID=UPI001253E3D4|nr:thiopurine S-methyltransferase [Hoeflea sp. EC-HK425]VVT13473.1 Thiopurine S-methyltransferase [Hoeflea sp. EC-HK425]|tara:strand:- start:514 stop:1149 length:636 start_codon:yes stop_codon:yes gene_type:complete
MEHDFWHDRWESGRIGFHEGEPNRLLVAHFPALAVPDGGRVFVPLCGKTRDIGWILSRGHQVVGAELSELAIRQLFEELGVEPTISDMGALKRYSAIDIEIFVGDIFALTPEMLGPVDAVFDRAALVALPEEMRASYATHLVDLTGAAPQLLVCFEYDQRLQSGPPFSITQDEVRRRYSGVYGISELVRQKLRDGMKGIPAWESVWLLTPH